MGIFSKRLMKWREPKIKGMVTPKNILFALGLILIISIPFGFWGGNGKFNIWICIFALGFMSVALIGLLLQPLLPGTLVQLKDNMIVRGPRGTNSRRSPYKNIQCVYYLRGCSYQVTQNIPVVVRANHADQSAFTDFQVVNKSEGFYSVKRFAVPQSVNLEQVVKILRDKGVHVIEGPLPS